MGSFFYGDGPVTHARTIEVLRNGLDVTEGGEFTVRIGSQWCYLAVDDCALRANAVLSDSTGLKLRLDDGRLLVLNERTLWEEPGKGLRCTVPARHSGRALSVRLTNRAQMDLAEWIRVEDGQAFLDAPQGRVPIPSRPPR
jgi:hypothetical protein